VIFFGSFTFKRHIFMLWHISDVHRHQYFSFQAGIFVPYEKTYNWNLPVSHINNPNHFQHHRFYLHHCDTLIVVILFHKSHNIPNYPFCWNSSSFCSHNFFGINRISWSELWSRSTKVCRNNTASSLALWCANWVAWRTRGNRGALLTTGRGSASQKTCRFLKFLSISELSKPLFDFIDYFALFTTESWTRSVNLFTIFLLKVNLYEFVSLYIYIFKYDLLSCWLLIILVFICEPIYMKIILINVFVGF
jgi:hypothetical protein